MPLTIQNNGTGNSFVVKDEASDATPFTIDAAGNVFMGSTGAAAGQVQLGMMISTDVAAGRNFMLRKAAPAGNAPAYTFLKSGGTNASPTTVASGDEAGNLVWEPFDGTNYSIAALIKASVDNTVSTGIVPGRLVFLTTNTSGVSTERMRIDSAGLVSITGTLSATSTISASGLAGSLLTSTVGAALGTASAGVATVPARADHVHSADDAWYFALIL